MYLHRLYKQIIMNKKIFMLSILLSFFCLKSMATVVYVDSAHVGGIQNGTSWATAFSNFQSGINAANAGDSVWVAKGTYMPEVIYTSFRMKADVKIFGGFTNTDISFSGRDWQTDSTVLAGNFNTVINNGTNNLTLTALLDGFFIINGTSDDVSGGMYNVHSSPSIRNCYFINNYGDKYGGAIGNFSSSPTIVNCIFLNNFGRWAGGAISDSASSPQIINCQFIGNSTNFSGYNVGGGAIFNGYISSPVISGCTFYNNISTNGGGIYNYYGTTPDITNCNFNNNTAQDGGGAGICNEICTPSITNCTFDSNTCTNYAYGAGIYDNFSNSTITACTFTNNMCPNTFGGGICEVGGASIIVDCSFFYNIGGSGGAIGNESGATIIRNNIFHGNKSTLYGGAIFNSFVNNTPPSSAGYIEKCSFTANKGSAGGAIYNGNMRVKDYKIVSCSFVADTSQGGAAIVSINGSSAIIENSLFSRNVGITFVANGASNKLVNCIIVNNNVMWGNAVIYNLNNSTASVSNTIINGNYNIMPNNNIVYGSSDEVGSNTQISYSLVQGMPADAALHILADTTNPQFADTFAGNYQLLPSSPCINAGNNDSLPPGINTDLLSNARVYANIIDLGCYEFYVPSVDLGNDTTICINDSLYINAHNGGGSYLWNTGDTTQDIWVHTNGTYYVTVTNTGGIATDTIHVIASPSLTVNLGPDKTINEGSSAILNAGFPGASYLWSTAATTQTIAVNTAGTYSVTVTNAAGCVGSDTIIVTINPLGLNDVDASKSSITIHPNPAKETVYINISDQKLLHTQAILTDAYGRIVRSIRIENKSQPLSLSGLATGIYILKMEDGAAVKIVKE